MTDTTDTKKIEQIVFTIEHHLTLLKKAVVDTDVEAIDKAGEDIASLGDMIRDAI